MRIETIGFRPQGGKLRERSMDQIIKRSTQFEAYHPEKIVRAMEKAFISVNTQISEAELNRMLREVEAAFPADAISVEKIQDLVEETLMRNGFYDVARSYILYRKERTRLRTVRNELLAALALPEEDAASLKTVLSGIQRSFPNLELQRLLARFHSMEKDNLDVDSRIQLLIRSAAELTTQEDPNWEKAAGRLLSFRFHRALAKTEEDLGITNFYEKLQYLTDQGLYGDYILEAYTREELTRAAGLMRPERDDLFTYAGLDLLIARYLIHNHRHVVLESPQEMYLGISLHLAMKEPKDRLLHVQRFYDMMSLQQVTMATPTLSNARKPYHQLSSCFIDTVPDSLEGIYRSISRFADVSKFGGGMGMYFGKVRSRGGSIRGFEGASGGVIRWIRVVNDTAVAVDQLGMRQGAVAVYLDVWHRDLPEFLQLRTNNGDDRMKAHDVFPAVCYPDLFWKMAKEDLGQDWYLMDPHDILIAKGYALEDFYGEEWEKRYWDCVHDGRIRKRVLTIREIVRLILKSAVETGTPFAFMRDAVNRANPNKHAGMIYCSNLCTEIAQNMAPAEILSTELKTEDGDPVIVNRVRPGDYVVCNLASLCLGHINVDDPEELHRITATTIRALDNVIDLNFYPVADARYTNQRYRAVGLGISGYHHMLAKHRLRWESEEHLAFSDHVFEEIAYAAIKASSDLARERGSYKYFEGSDWKTGAYFDSRNYTGERWEDLKKSVAENGMRNGYLMASAPTSSTSILIGTTAGLDPVMNRFYLEEKKGAMLPRVAPDLSLDTYWFYKQAHHIDQTWSVRAAAVRQRHIDQAQSMNFWITNEYKMSQLLNLYIQACESGVKTIYYVRSKALDPDDCESCSA